MSYHIPCEVAVQIREDGEIGFSTERDLAVQYHVSQTAVHDIVTGRSHRDCAEPTEPEAPKTLGQFLSGD